MSWGFAADQPDGAQCARTRALLPGRKIKPLAGETRPFAERVEDRGKHEGSRHAQVRGDCPGHPEPHRGRRPRAQRQATDGRGPLRTLRREQDHRQARPALPLRLLVRPGYARAQDLELPPHHPRRGRDRGGGRVPAARRGRPLLEISQVGFLDDGTPFEFSVARSNGMRSELRDVNVI